MKDIGSHKGRIQKLKLFAQEMVESASQDYSNVLRSASLDNEISPICMTIDDMLIRLDELESLLVNVKGETNVIMEQHTSSILSFVPNFEKLKERIDQLQKLVDIINSNVDEAEKSIDIAEAELNVSDFSLKSLLFKPLLAKARAVSQSNTLPTADEPLLVTNLKDGEFQAVPIFSTSDYFNT